MSVNGNQGSAPNYEPNSLNGPVHDPSTKLHQDTVVGKTGRYNHTHPNTNFEQPRTLFRKVMTETDRNHLIENISGDLG